MECFTEEGLNETFLIIVVTKMHEMQNVVAVFGGRVYE